MTQKRTVVKITVGRSELIGFPSIGLKHIPAKVDTGAYTTAVHATDIKLDEKTKVLSFRLMEGHPATGGKGESVTTSDFRKTEVVSSNGKRQDRYVVALPIKIGSRSFKTPMTLADRSKMRFPVLLGRQSLSGHFVIDTEDSHVDRNKIKKHHGIDFPDDEEGRYENRHTV